jgi:hypothetical protein
MQHNVTADDYEIVVVDNGSREPIDREACSAFGAHIRWLEVHDASPSPVRAANEGIGQARAALVGVLIDGARLASPGLLHHALVAARLHGRAVIVTLGFHLGQELQQRAVADGYDEATEDALLAGVDWTADGYRLFDISVLGGSSRAGWFALPAESNAVFLPADLWSELGAYDEAFVSPGGGLANLDLLVRACSLPRVKVVTLLGEATFHQVHGGVSTNAATPRWGEFHGEYMRVRGKRFAVPPVRPLCLGTPPPQVVATLGAAPTGAGDTTLRRRYVELLKKALLNETALEAEAAYFMARDALAGDGAFDDAATFDMRTHAPQYVARVARARTEGRYVDPERGHIGFAHTMVGRPRLDNVDHCVSLALQDDVPGDLVECGVWRGGAAILMRGILAAWEDGERCVWVADSFAGLPKPEAPHDTRDLSAELRPELAVSQEQVAATFDRFDLLDDQVRFLPGWFKDTLPTAAIESIAVLRLDGDLYESTMDALVNLYPRLSPGGWLIVDDFHIPACVQAVTEYREANGVTAELQRVNWAAAWQKEPALAHQPTSST